MKVYALNNMPPIKILFFRSKRKMRKALEKDGMHPEIPDVDGFTHTFESDDGPISVVYVGRRDKSPETISILTHESVHVAQAYWEWLGEASPSSEFMAYTIQQVFLWLYEEFLGVKHAS